MLRINFISIIFKGYDLSQIRNFLIPKLCRMNDDSGSLFFVPLFYQHILISSSMKSNYIIQPKGFFFFSSLLNGGPTKTMQETTFQDWIVQARQFLGSHSWTKQIVTYSSMKCNDA